MFQGTPEQIYLNGIAIKTINKGDGLCLAVRPIGNNAQYEVLWKLIVGVTNEFNCSVEFCFRWLKHSCAWAHL